MTPLQELISWMLDAHGGQVHRDIYYARAKALGCSPPGLNGAFGTSRPLLVREGDLRVVTAYGRLRAEVW
jgi:hypothetical protein